MDSFDAKVAIIKNTRFKCCYKGLQYLNNENHPIFSYIFGKIKYCNLIKHCKYSKRYLVLRMLCGDLSYLSNKKKTNGNLISPTQRAKSAQSGNLFVRGDKSLLTYFLATLNITEAWEGSKPILGPFFDHSR